MLDNNDPSNEYKNEINKELHKFVMLRAYIFKKVDDEIANGESTIRDSEENYNRYYEEVMYYILINIRM